MRSFSQLFKCHIGKVIYRKAFFSALAGEFLRISRSSMLMEDLVSSSKALVVRMKNEGGKDARISRGIKKSSGKRILPDFYF